MEDKVMPTSICPMCGGSTNYNQNLLGYHPNTHGFHSYCSNCRASFSNAKNPEKRVVIWDDIEKNIYPQDTQSVQRLKNIINHYLK